jgi:hypothetical protein
MAICVAASVAGLAGVAVAAPASAATPKCKSSKHTVDDPAYDGAWPDNFDFTVKICAQRSGSYVSTWAKISMDGPPSFWGTHPFDAVKFLLTLKRSAVGADPVVKSKNFYPTSRFNTINSAGNSSYTTSKIRYKFGSKTGLGDSALFLDWDNDGKGYKRYDYTATPVL